MSSSPAPSPSAGVCRSVGGAEREVPRGAHGARADDVGDLHGRHGGVQEQESSLLAKVTCDCSKITAKQVHGLMSQPPIVFGPDENGVKKIIEYRFNEEGNMERVVTIISPVPEKRKLNSAIAVKERTPMGSNVAKTSAYKPACGGGRKGLRPSPFIREPYDDDPQKIKYDDRTVRVSNLPSDISESALMEQFDLFGCVTSVYIPEDGKTESDSCIGFVKYAQRKEAEYAIKLLTVPIVYNKFKYQVAWAAPRSI